MRSRSDRSRSRSARSRSARSRSQSRWFRWSRSRSTSIGVVPVTGEIAIVVRWCGWFRRGWFRRNEGLTEQCVCERLVRVREGRKPIEVKITTETNFSRFWLIFRSNWKCFQFDRILQHNQTRDFPEIDFRKSISVETNGALMYYGLLSTYQSKGIWFPEINFSRNKRSLNVLRTT